MPTDKYTWRPAEGVRPVGEVHTHIITANYAVSRALGTRFPAGRESPVRLRVFKTTRRRFQQALQESFAHFRSAVLALSDTHADEPQKEV